MIMKETRKELDSSVLQWQYNYCWLKKLQHNHEVVPRLVALISMLYSLDVSLVSAIRLEYRWNTCSTTEAVSALACS